MSHSLFGALRERLYLSETSGSQGDPRSVPGSPNHVSPSSLNASKTKNLNNKEGCHICHCSFTLINKKLVCKGCGESMCYIHSSLLDKFNLERICDSCMHQILIKQAEEEIAEIKQKYSGDLSFSILEREEKTRLINKAIGRIRKLKIDIKEGEKKAKKQQESYGKKLEKVDNEISQVQQEIDRYKILLEEQEKIERVTYQKLLLTGEECYGKQQAVNFLNDDLDDTSKKLEDLKQKVKTHLPQRAIKSSVCQLCSDLLVQQFPDAFDFSDNDPVPQTHKFREMSANVCKCRVF